MEPGMGGLIPVLESCSKKFSSKWAVIDAFDECNDNHKGDILDLFIKLQEFGYKLLISGRPPLEPRNLSNVSRLPIQATDEDIERYIIKELNRRNARPKVRTGCLELAKDVGGM